MQFLATSVYFMLLAFLLASLNGVHTFSRLNLQENSEHRFNTWRNERSAVEDASEISAFGPNEASWNLAQTSFKWEEMTREMMKNGNAIK
ncbi:hypothetical protein Ocin01_03404 [Orchesella cincta]|uniref:Uncharacterized protein n=1 Tax=Orchesella cincta TaxID=48709 RepID=A0A1D2NEA5_ORCCI|nr:hypothetical protein Ocin01_03404 [Orchesella cincta]